MDINKQMLCGSPSRDAFKFNHKRLDRKFYALDVDFLLVEKEPFPGIDAALDFKTEKDSPTFSEVIAYNDFMKRGIDVYIVSGCPETYDLKIYKWLGGHHGKPVWRCSLVEETKDSGEFQTWERSIRDQYKAKYRP